MSRGKRYSLLWFLLIVTATLRAQFDPGSVCSVDNGKIIYHLNLQWNDAQKREVVKLFRLDSTIWEKITPASSEVLMDSVPWKVKYVTPNLVELSKDLVNKPVFHLNENDVFLMEDSWKVAPGYVDQEKVIYGANGFSSSRYFRYENGVAQFYLPGFQKNSHVYIAGSFNQWDPGLTAMQFVDSGWMVKVPLPTGKHLYKFIADGRWMTDPNNKISENDGQGNINSVVYCPNYIFRLKGYRDAKRVVVAGSFNNWNRNELRMHQTPAGWILPFYIKDGTYTYKFLVDNQWITDPENMLTRPDGQGNLNSVISRGEAYVFRLKGYTNASKVFVAGNFNNWNSSELAMGKTPDGWQLPYNLSHGNYEYKFIVDGKWMTDPENPFTSGKGDRANSCLAFNTTYTFTLDAYLDAKNVVVTGDFSGWNPEGFRMVKRDGKWMFPVYLSPGKHLYKFIVDGNWILDPGNKLWEDNEYGTGNSILWIQ